MASARPVTRLVAPGPEVAMHTPTRPVVFAQPSAAKISPCMDAKRVRTCRFSRREGTQGVSQGSMQTQATASLKQQQRRQQVEQPSLGAHLASPMHVCVHLLLGPRCGMSRACKRVCLCTRERSPAHGGTGSSGWWVSGSEPGGSPLTRRPGKRRPVFIRLRHGKHSGMHVPAFTAVAGSRVTRRIL